MPKLSFMKWFPLDWLRDTRILSMEGKSTWIDILCMAWNEPERGVYTRSKIDFCRELNIPTERYDPIISELAKVSTVTFRNDLVTVMSRRMVKQETHYKKNANRQARYRSSAKVTQAVTDKTLDVRCSQDVRHLKTTAGETLPEFVLRWKTATAGERQAAAAEIAIGLKSFGLSFRVEEDLYEQIMGGKDERNGTIRSKSIDQQALERRRAQGFTEPRKEASAGEVFARIRGLPKVPPET